MPRYVIGWLLGILGNAVGLVWATLLLGESFQLSGIFAFLACIGTFAIFSGNLAWLIFLRPRQRAWLLVIAAGLVSTVLELVVGSLVVQGLVLQGGGWLWGTLMLWAFSSAVWVGAEPWRERTRVLRRRSAPV